MEAQNEIHKEIIGQKIVRITHEIRGRIDHIWKIILSNGHIITFQHEQSEGSVEIK